MIDRATKAGTSSKSFGRVIPSTLSAREKKRVNEKCLRFEEFDALAECANDLFEDAHVVVRTLAGYGGETAMGVGRVTE